MIKAAELRTGNIIFIDDKHTAIVVSVDAERGVIRTKNDLNQYTDGTTGDEFYLPSSFITGIPLTTEWLERCGFKEGTNCLFGKQLKLGIHPDYTYIGTLTSTSAAYVAPTQYVHQLQNLYFALTGEELTIK